jgi:hypothetical protein
MAPQGLVRPKVGTRGINTRSPLKARAAGAVTCRSMIQSHGSHLLPTRENARRPPRQAVLPCHGVAQQDLHSLSRLPSSPSRTNAIGRSESVRQKRSNQQQRGVVGWGNTHNVCRICRRTLCLLRKQNQRLPETCSVCQARKALKHMEASTEFEALVVGPRPRHPIHRCCQVKATSGANGDGLLGLLEPHTHLSCISQPVGMETFLDRAVDE